MPENDDEQYTPEGQQDAPKMVRMSRDNIDRLEAKALERDALARENAFLKAGVKTDDPKLSYFYKGYDGDLTADAIRAAAVDAGFLPKPEPTPEETQRTESAQAAERVAQAAAGQAAPLSTASTREQEYRDAIAKGGIGALGEVAAKYGPVVGR